MADMPKKLGRYEIVRELGKGAMGVVYEGIDPNIGRRVAIKTARRDVLEASGLVEEMMERFLREARAAGNLNHPNIITIYDSDEEDGLAYIAMEYLDGGDLRDTLDRRATLDIKEIAEIGAEICDALAAAHDDGVVHRDVKPANILTPSSGKLIVADFGIARVADSNLTQEGAMIGTPHYMSPEQFMGHKIDGRTDLFSVAIILYELLTGEKPFGGEALSTVMHHVIKSTPTAPSELNVAVPESMDTVVMKALAKRPAERYVDGRAMAAALREALQPSPDPVILSGSDASATVIGSPEQRTSETAYNNTVSVPPTPETLRKRPLDSTTPSQVLPDGSTSVETALGAERNTEKESDASAARRFKPAVLGGVLAAILVLGAGLFVLLRSGDIEAPIAGTGGPTDSVFVRVAGFDDRSAYVDAQSMGDEDLFYELIEAGKGRWLSASVVILNGDGQEIGRYPISDVGSMLELPSNTLRFVAQFESEGYRPESQTWDRESAWQDKRIVGLAPES